MFSFDENAEHARQLLLKDGFHVPMLLIAGTREPSMLLLQNLPPAPTRQAQFALAGAMLARVFGQRLGAIEQLILINEAWLANVPRSERDSAPRPSQHPGRIEVLIVAEYLPELKSARARLYEIVRQVPGNEQSPAIFAEQIEGTEPGEAEAQAYTMQAFVRGYQGAQV